MEENDLEKEISTVLRLRNDNEFLFHYVMHIAQKLYDGEIPEYEEDEFLTFEEAISEGIGIVLYSMIDTEEIDDDLYDHEYNKTYQRMLNFATNINGD